MKSGVRKKRQFAWLLVATALGVIAVVVLDLWNRNAAFQRLTPDNSIIWAVATSGTTHEANWWLNQPIRSKRLIEVLQTMDDFATRMIGRRLFNPATAVNLSSKPSLIIWVGLENGLAGRPCNFRVAVRDHNSVVAVSNGCSGSATNVEWYAFPLDEVKGGTVAEFHRFTLDPSFPTNSTPVARLRL